mgnify:FL=1
MRRTTGSLTGVARLVTMLVLTLATLTLPARVFAQQPEAAAPAAQEHAAGGEVNIVLPDLSQTDVGGFNGRTLLMGGIAVAIIGIGFGLLILNQLKNLPVHRSMSEISELIYETCKTYLQKIGRAHV